MAEDSNTKTRVVKREKTLKDGTRKTYYSTETYKVKGYIHPDGTVTKFSPAQIDEMKRLRELGVPIKRIAANFNTSHLTISKLVK